MLSHAWYLLSVGYSLLSVDLIRCDDGFCSDNSHEEGRKLRDVAGQAGDRNRCIRVGVPLSAREAGGLWSSD